jgi:uncharacterized membrane protein YuzA (DUF378 family)
MAHIAKDFFTGILIILLGAILGLIGFALFVILSFLLKIFSVFAGIFFFIFLCLCAVWSVGFFYRKIKENVK